MLENFMSKMDRSKLLARLIGIFILILFSLTRSEAQSTEIRENKFETKGIQRVTYELDGMDIYATLLFRNDSIIFMERVDSTGKFLEDHRAIDEFAESRNISLGEPYRSGVRLCGPRPCDTLMYYISEPIPIDEETKGKKLIRRYDVRNDTAYFELNVDRPGTYYYVGNIIISCDTLSYPRQYQLRGEFSVSDD